MEPSMDLAQEATLVEKDLDQLSGEDEGRRDHEPSDQGSGREEQARPRRRDRNLARQEQEQRGAQDSDQEDGRSHAHQNQGPDMREPIATRHRPLDALTWNELGLESCALESCAR
jgi:hypothetical protein